MSKYTCEKCLKGFDHKKQMKAHLNGECDGGADVSSSPSHSPPSFIEVCAGAGGLSSGLIKAGWHPLLLNDNNKDCCETLKSMHKGVNVVCSDMNSLDLTEYIGKVDLLTGGVPCQSFSQAGQRKGFDDDRGGLMLKFIDLIFLIKPKIFMIENVKGLVTHNKGESMKLLLDALRANDVYDVQYSILNAAYFDVPQKRERVIIIGRGKRIMEGGSPLTYFPTPNSEICTLATIWKENGETHIPLPHSLCAKYNEEKVRLYKMIPQGGCWVNLPEEEQKNYLGNSYFSGGGKRGILYRLSISKPCLTLLCSPSQKQTERCHPFEERPLSVREYARIQTFDDDYIFHGSMASQYKQIGNAVPVNLAYRIGKTLLNLV